LGVILLGVLFSGRLKKTLCSQPKTANITANAKPLSQTTIDKSFDFLIKKGGKDNFSIKIDKATIVKLVTNKGKPLMAKEGQAYLLLYLLIDNNLQSSLNLNSQNYFRLLVDDKKYAPDLYNTGVQIAPISTKSDQLGFVVKEDQKEFKLQVGEIDGKKEVIDIKF